MFRKIVSAFLYSSILFVAILPFRFIDNDWISIALVFAYTLVIYIVNKIIFTKSLQKRSLSQLRDSRRMLRGEGFVLEQSATFGNITEFSNKKSNARELVVFQVRKSGIYVRTWVSINFGILFKNISKIEIVDINPDNNPQFKKFSCFMRIFAMHEQAEVFLFRFQISEEFIHWLIPVYKGELVYKTYDEFKSEMKSKT